jgi:methyltransferase (TIGR00027 family)
MNPVSKTAYYCCGVRMLDAERRRPLCGDNYAKRFMDDSARAFFAPFSANKRAIRGNAARHRIIDDFLRSAVGERPELTVLTIGAGFDTRPYRLHAGTWIELDEAPVIALKNQKLPLSECKNKLTRVAIDFAREPLRDKLAPHQGPTVVVLEGVLMYLSEEVIVTMLQTLRALFPEHVVICDLARRQFFEKHSADLRARLEQLGARFHVVDDPRAVFLGQGYRLRERRSIVKGTLDFGLPRMLGWLANTLPKELAEGYEVAVFEVPRA